MHGLVALADEAVRINAMSRGDDKRGRSRREDAAWPFVRQEGGVASATAFLQSEHLYAADAVSPHDLDSRREHRRRSRKIGAAEADKTLRSDRPRKRNQGEADRDGKPGDARRRVKDTERLQRERRSDSHKRVSDMGTGQQSDKRRAHPHQRHRRDRASSTSPLGQSLRKDLDSTRVPLRAQSTSPTLQGQPGQESSRWERVAMWAPPPSGAPSRSPQTQSDEIDAHRAQWRSSTTVSPPSEPLPHQPHENPSHWSWTSYQAAQMSRRQELLSSLERLRASVAAADGHTHTAGQSSMYPSWWDPAVTAYTEHGPTGPVAAAWKAEMQRLPIATTTFAVETAPKHNPPFSRLNALGSTLRSTRESAEDVAVADLRQAIQDQIRMADARAHQYGSPQYAFHSSEPDVPRSADAKDSYVSPLTQRTSGKTEQMNPGLMTKKAVEKIHETGVSEKNASILSWTESVQQSAPLAVGAPIMPRYNEPLVVMHAGNDVNGLERAAFTRLTAAVRSAADSAQQRLQTAVSGATKAFATQQDEDMQLLEEELQRQRAEKEQLTATIVNQRREARKLKEKLEKLEASRGEEAERREAKLVKTLQKTVEKLATVEARETSASRDLAMMEKIDGYVARKSRAEVEALTAQQNAARAQARFESARKRAEAARESFESVRKASTSQRVPPTSVSGAGLGNIGRPTDGKTESKEKSLSQNFRQTSQPNDSNPEVKMDRITASDLPQLNESGNGNDNSTVADGQSQIDPMHHSIDCQSNENESDADRQVSCVLVD
eukprot:m.13769 g.13769  ORF g.13769 m.13769 type:complete len:779 (+) comp4709_c0_seq1:306-2642(+)